MAITGIVFFVILFMIEFRIFSLIYNYFSKKHEIESEKSHTDNDDEEEEEDDDVKEEKTRVDAMTLNDLQAHNLVLQKLTKTYGKLLAVNQISVAVQR